MNEEVAISSILHLVRRGMITCELGVRSGESSQRLLKMGCFVYMVDCWKDYSGSPERGELHERDYNKTMEIVARYPNMCKVIRCMSDDAVREVPDNLDFIYIDCNHDYEYVKKDMENYWPKIKNGGIMTGDDWSLDTVQKAVGEFSTWMGVKYEVVGRNWVIKKE